MKKTEATSAADWLVSAWDQNAGLYVAAPAASVVEEVCGAWIFELFGLPEVISFGLVTGGQMANFTALAAARHQVLERAGWDVEADGLLGEAPGEGIPDLRCHPLVGTVGRRRPRRSLLRPRPALRRGASAGARGLAAHQGVRIPLPTSLALPD